MRRVVLFAAINLVVLGSLTAPLVTGLPLVISRLVAEPDRTSVLAAITISGAIASVVANPLFGFLSDRTPGRFGRRRPWMLGGVVVGLVASVVIVEADSVIVLGVGWVLAQVAYNASLAAVAAMLGDQVSERRRASASGVFGAAAFLGTLPPLILAAVVPSRLEIVVLAMPVAAVVVVIVCCLFLTDAPLRRSRTGGRQSDPARAGSRPDGLRQDDLRQDDPRPDAVAPAARSRLAGIRRHRLFAWIWVQRFLLQLAFSLVTTFTLFFVMSRMAVDAEKGSSVVALTTLIGGASVVVAALGAGFLASRRGRYGPYILVVSLGLVVAAVLRATVTGSGSGSGTGTDTGAATSQLWISAAIGGLALGTFYAVDLALALRTVPAGETGTYLGVFNIAETLPQTIAPALALAVFAATGGDPLSGSTDNYTALYLIAGAVALLALVPLVFLRPVLNRTDPNPLDAAGRQGQPGRPVRR
ncbi:MFS transporter [Herbiconiux solani]|uniref:MFS transporter n=1 Tax=Herbiconiux solani TaxID=661329 RepID=UPI000825F7AE|nr:MFS transporter [Herbiconiux solani]